MDKNGVIGELLEQGQQTVVNATKTTVSDIANSLKGQIGLPNETNNSSSNSGHSNQTQVNQGQQTPSENISQQNSGSASSEISENEQTKEMVRDFYSPSNATESPLSKEQEEAETKHKLDSLRKQLHDEVYYQPLISPKKDGQGEERQAEKVEREEEEDDAKKMELQEKKAKASDDIAKTRAQTAVEANRGVSG